MSSPATASPQLEITSSSSRKGNCGSVTPPPATRVSFNPTQVGLRYGWVEIISAERRYVKNWGASYVNKTQRTGCGAEAWISLSNLARRISKGCQQCSEQQRQRIPRWLDRILTEAKQRCTNRMKTGWMNYGGRGIEFSFPSVLKAGLWVLKNLGERPSPRHQLDRIDNSGHYEPGNLRWATRPQRGFNTRRSVVSEWDYRTDEWPYAFHTVARFKRKGLTREETLERAALAVEEKRKGRRRIAARLAALTS
jgi:hypothetical protein